MRSHRDPTIQVMSPGVVVEAAGEEVAFRGRWGADIISGASPLMAAPDVMTRATEFKETRHEGALGVDWMPRAEQRFSTGVQMSREPDYLSQSAMASAAQEFFDRHTTLGVSARAGFDRVWRVDVPDFGEEMWNGAAALEVTQIVSANLLAHLTYDVEGRFGYQANPYRMVPVFDGASRIQGVLSEEHPRQRLRHAVEPVVVWAPLNALFLHGAYRFYGDDWGVQSHTVRAELWRVWFGDKLRTRLNFRGYTQGAANFYQARYDEVNPLRSGDYRLSRMRSLSGGLRLDGRLPVLSEGSLLLVSASYEATLYRFANYAFRSSMVANSFGLSITMEWR